MAGFKIGGVVKKESRILLSTHYIRGKIKKKQSKIKKLESKISDLILEIESLKMNLELLEEKEG
jgi:hypothetical protein